MARRYRFLEEGSREKIAEKIRDALDIAVREKKKTQGQIAKIIEVNKNTLTNWRQGRVKPRDDEFRRFLAFLGRLDPPIGIEFFNSIFEDDPYGEDSHYVASMGESLKQYARVLGLDLNFLRFIISSAGFEDIYEQWGPIVMEGNKAPSDPEKLKVHRRLTPRESNVAKYAEDFRIGSRILNVNDLNVVKELQDFILRVLSLSLLDRRLQMEKEINAADEMRKEKYLRAKQGKAALLIKDEDMILTVGELGSIDKYYKEFTKELPEDLLITEIPWEDLGVLNKA